MRRGRKWPYPILVLFLLIGCGKKQDRVAVYPVTGKVTFQGKPAANAFVAFHPAGGTEGSRVPASGHVDDAGVYRLTTFESNDGAPAGEYIVTVIWTTLVDESESGPDRLNGKFATPAKSSLRATVNTAPTEIPTIDLGR